jgi:hypothetical protein
MNSIQVGDTVLVKAHLSQDETWLADSVKQIGQGRVEKQDDSDEEEENGEGGKPESIRENSAYCTEGKQVEPHPLATKIAEHYDVSEDWVMEAYCNGFSFGSILLAIKTSQLESVTLDADTILADRAAGISWGKIWLELGLIGSEKNGHSPPGKYKRPTQDVSEGA